jgi:folate-binding protein YgfZ
MPSAFLADRGIVRVQGDGARDFLQGLVTCDTAKVTTRQAAYGALLTPQGKIIIDFIVSASNNAYWLDCPSNLAADFARRLRLYRLRLKLDIDDLTATHAVAAIWDAPSSALVDPRDSRLGERLVGERPALLARYSEADAMLYDERRIAVGVPRGGVDFVYGDTFPHEANMDLLNGLDFKKGCYIGQEVVSRVEHRGLARKRVTHVSFDGVAPAPGVTIRAGAHEIGTMGSSAAGVGLAMLRLDRVEEARAAGEPIMCGDTRLNIPLD